MPKAYEEVRDSYVRRGYSRSRAKELAARWWNRTHPNNPNPWNREKKRPKKK